MADFDEPHAFGNGFNPNVCRSCEHHVTDRVVNKCGLCGCPTGRRMPMDLLDAPPESCPYLQEHSRRG